MVDENWKNVAKLLTGLDDCEQGLIANVLKRDLDLNEKNDQRVFKLKRILKDFKKRGIGLVLHFAFFILIFVWKLSKITIQKI